MAGLRGRQPSLAVAPIALAALIPLIPLVPLFPWSLLFRYQEITTEQEEQEE